MFTEREPQGDPPGQLPRSARRVLRYTWIVVAIAAIYAVSVLLYRWSQSRDYAAKQKAAAAAAQRSEDAQSLETMGGNEFNILNFYASPGEIHRGESVQLCYGVANTQSVKIEPDTGRGMWPSLSRCIDISPAKTTTYTLTAQNSQGKTKTASLTITVL
ncbi:MAG TPA: hypothetical protein VJR26_10735 [Candidatus Acidoferrales bacterium]|nr:hypothetical protein [Candidatus Acidoferrales bacterium]